MKKLLAFTLAETLIVIGIIGVVSALTLPNLNSSTGEKEKVAKVKKIYQNLDDAIGRAVAIYGPVDEWFVDDTTFDAKIARFKNRVTEFMKVTKDCGTSTGCWSTKPSDDFFDYQNIRFGGTQFVIIADGTALSFERYSGLPSFRIRADIDGPNKGKTEAGVDIFDFTYSGKTLYPSSDRGEVGVMDALNATVWVINFDNMDYLKCLDDLEWGVKTSCK